MTCKRVKKFQNNFPTYTHCGILPGQPLELRYSFNQLIHFLKLNNFLSAFVLPYKVATAGFTKYSTYQEFKTGSFLPTIVSFDVETTFEEFVYFTQESFGYHQMDYYVFNETLDFVIQYVRHRDFFILYFSVEKLAENSSFTEDMLIDFDEMYENSSDGFNQIEIDALKSTWLPQQYKIID